MGNLNPKRQACLSSFINNGDIEGHLAQLEGGNASQGGAHDAGMLDHLLDSLLLPLLLLFVEAPQL